MKTISLKIPEYLDEKLAQASREKGVNKSVVLREAIVAYVAGPQSSFAQKAADLSGCLSGPTDLSSNKDHMADYGQ